MSTGRRTVTRSTAAEPLVPHRQVEGADNVLMIFTSGTSGDPKAVRFAHAMGVLCGASLVDRFELTADDVCYLSMPLFHSTGSRQAGRGDRVRSDDGACQVLAVAVPFRHSSVQRNVHELRRQAAGAGTGDTGAARMSPTTRCGRRSATRAPSATSRSLQGDSGASWWTASGQASSPSSSCARTVARRARSARDIGRQRVPRDTVTECATAVFDEHGALANFDEAVGELVNTYGVGGFTGYYNDTAATDERMRTRHVLVGAIWRTATTAGGSSWPDGHPTGCGWTGRTWRRVRIERVRQRVPEVSVVAIYAVPDEQVGDQGDGGHGAQRFVVSVAIRGVSWPSSPICHRRRGRGYVRINTALPQTATNKILKRTPDRGRRRGRRRCCCGSASRGAGHMPLCPPLSDRC